MSMDDVAPYGPSVDLEPLNVHEDEIYAAALAGMQPFESIEECQAQYDLEKQNLNRIVENATTTQQNTGENEDTALIFLHSWLRRLNNVQTRQPNMRDRDRVPHLVYPEAPVKNMNLLLDLYRTLEKSGQANYWQTIVDGQTLKSLCFQCLARLIVICRESRKFNEPTAMPYRLPVETYFDHENIRPEQEPTGEPTGEPPEGALQALLLQLKHLIN